jgi:hypothetical protein
MKSKTSKKNKQNTTQQKSLQHKKDMPPPPHPPPPLHLRHHNQRKTQEKQNLKLSSPNPTSSHLSLFLSPCSSPGSQIRLQIGHGKQKTQKNKNKKRNTKKDEKDARLLSPPGWLTRGRGEERRDEIVQQLP